MTAKMTAKERHEAMRRAMSIGVTLDQKETDNITGDWGRKCAIVQAQILSGNYGNYVNHDDNGKTKTTPYGKFLYVITKIVRVDAMIGTMSGDGCSVDMWHEVPIETTDSEGKRRTKWAIDKSLVSTCRVGQVISTNCVHTKTQGIEKFDDAIIGIYPKFIVNKNTGLLCQEVNHITGVNQPRAFWEMNKNIKLSNDKMSQSNVFMQLRNIPVSQRIFSRKGTEGSYNRHPIICHVNMGNDCETDPDTGTTLDCAGVVQCFPKWKKEDGDKATRKCASWCIAYGQINTREENDHGHTTFIKCTMKFDRTISQAFGIVDPELWASGIGVQLVETCPMVIIGNEGGNDQADYAAINGKRQNALRDAGEIDSKTTHRSIHTEINLCAVDLAGGLYKCHTQLTKEQVMEFSAAMSRKSVPAFVGVQQLRAMKLPTPCDVQLLNELSTYDAQNLTNSDICDFFAVSNDVSLKGDAAATTARIKSKFGMVAKPEDANFYAAVFAVHKRTSPEQRMEAEAEYERKKAQRARAADAMLGISMDDLGMDVIDTETKTEVKTEAETNDDQSYNMEIDPIGAFSSDEDDMEAPNKRKREDDDSAHAKRAKKKAKKEKKEKKEKKAKKAKKQ